MSGYYDKYGGNPSYIEVTAGNSSLTTTYGSGGWGNGAYIKEYERPVFKPLFQDVNLFDPNKHRAYLVNPNRYSPYAETSNYSNYYNNYPRSFDRTKIELVTVEKDGKKYTTLSPNTIDYLKKADEVFAQRVVWLQRQKEYMQSYYNNLPQFQQEVDGKEIIKHINECDSLINQAENSFANFVGGFADSLVDLNRPFLYEDGNNSYPVSVGNFSPYELDEMINDIFGNVTGDNFIPIANKNIYEAKEETSCCLKYCSNKDYFRMKDVSYQDSQQKINDDKEFEKYKNSDFYEPYSPPPSYQQININQYMQMYQQGMAIVNSPINYLFDKLKPYIDGLSGSTSWVKYKITAQNNNINIDLDFR